MPSRSFRASVALLTLVLLAACSTDPSPAASDPTSSGTSSSTGAEHLTLESLPDLVAGVEPSIVSVLRADGGEGSGVVWSSDGVIVTNNHVVDGAGALVVAFADGQRVDAELIASDPRTDLAVIRADRQDLPPATFADTLPEVGELALALGNPIGFENSASQGIVSGLHRSVPGSAQVSAALVDLIQTDAAISPGNSGGALVNGDGEVMGINVAYIPPNSQAGAVSIGFAIPSTTVTDIVEQLLDDGTAEHPYIGIRPATLTSQLGQQLNVDADFGVAVLEVERGGPAADAGIEPGDVIQSVDGTRVDSVESLLGALREHAVGDTVTVTIVRAGEELDVDVTLGDLPPVG
jgi:serine protease DegQ